VATLVTKSRKPRRQALKKRLRTLKDSDIQVTALRDDRGVIMMGDRTHLGDHADFGSLYDGWDEKNGTDTKSGDFKDR
jgi:hypothetical protein